MKEWWSVNKRPRLIDEDFDSSESSSPASQQRAVVKQGDKMVYYYLLAAANKERASERETCPLNCFPDWCSKNKTLSLSSGRSYTTKIIYLWFPPIVVVHKRAHSQALMKEPLYCSLIPYSFLFAAVSVVVNDKTLPLLVSDEVEAWKYWTMSRIENFSTRFICIQI